MTSMMKKSVLKHLTEDRHVDVNLHNPVVDEEERVATFFLYNLSGQVVGYQQYRPDADKMLHNNPKLGRYFTYTCKNKLPLFGVETLNRSGTVFLTEGLFDACRLTELGCPAVASLSNNPKQALPFFRALNRRVVAVCDNDQAGKKLAKYGTDFYVVSKGDLGDAKESEVLNLVKEFS